MPCQHLYMSSTVQQSAAWRSGAPVGSHLLLKRCTSQNQSTGESRCAISSDIPLLQSCQESSASNTLHRSKTAAQGQSKGGGKWQQQKQPGGSSAGQDRTLSHALPASHCLNYTVKQRHLDCLQHKASLHEVAEQCFQDSPETKARYMVLIF